MDVDAMFDHFCETSTKGTVSDVPETNKYVPSNRFCKTGALWFPLYNRNWKAWTIAAIDHETAAPPRARCRPHALFLQHDETGYEIWVEDVKGRETLLVSGLDPDGEYGETTFDLKGDSWITISELNERRKQYYAQEIATLATGAVAKTEPKLEKADDNEQDLSINIELLPSNLVCFSAYGDVREVPRRVTLDRVRGDVARLSTEQLAHLLGLTVSAVRKTIRRNADAFTYGRDYWLQTANGVLTGSEFEARDKLSFASNVEIESQKDRVYLWTLRGFFTMLLFRRDKRLAQSVFSQMVDLAIADNKLLAAAKVDTTPAVATAETRFAELAQTLDAKLSDAIALMQTKLTEAVAVMPREHRQAAAKVACHPNATGVPPRELVTHSVHVSDRPRSENAQLRQWWRVWSATNTRRLARARNSFGMAEAPADNSRPHFSHKE